MLSRRSILSPFLKFPDEAAIIGRLFAGYTTLEVGLMSCVQVVRDDFDAILKAMFRVRGETARIDIADALGRQFYEDRGLGTEFAMAIGAVRYCLKIRNQYAHCVWYDDRSGNLAFVNVEEIVRDNARLVGLQSLTVLEVDVPILQAQEEYFVYADDLLTWTDFEGRLRDGRMGQIKTNPQMKPNQIGQPALHIPVGDDERRRALTLLADNPDGCTRTIMLTRGFSLALLNQLFRSGLATIEREERGDDMIESVLKITEAGRQVLE